MRKATLTWIKLLLAASASRVAYGFDDCIDARCAFRKSIYRSNNSVRFVEKKYDVKVAPFNSGWTRCARW